jgi:hypothetical protein
MRRLIILAALLTTQLSEAAAQAAADLAPGTRVRVFTAQGGKVVGGVHSMREDTLVVSLQREAAALSIPLSTVSRIEVSRGDRSRAKNALRWGTWAFIGGGALFGTMCTLDDACRDPGRPDHSAAQAGLEVGLFMGTGAAFWGAVLGAIFPGEQWDTAPARVGVAPGREGGVVVGVSF